MIDKLSSILSRLFFLVGIILFLLAFLQKIIALIKVDTGTYYWTGYESGRLIEIAGIFFIFIMVLLLRQIREQLKNRTS